MGIFRSLAGTVRLELTSADVAASLQTMNKLGIRISNVETCGDLTACFTASRRSLREIESLAARKGERLKIKSRNGLSWKIRELSLRPVLLIGIVLLLVLVLFVPSRVFFVEVEGNDAVPSRLILEAAQDAGIRFGASRRAVRSEKMKNELLGVLPQLRWAGVNTYGCTAVISVRERVEEKRTQKKYSVSSIVSAADGVITSCTVTSGNALCSIGQAVQKGQMLISGYTDCAQTVTATRAAGEIFALTQHDLTVVTPSESLSRGEIREQIVNFSLQVGKKRINFKKDSGIYAPTCVKMYTQYDLTLPGGYRLPVSLLKETVLVYDTQTQPRSEETVVQQLSDFAKDYLRCQMVALTVLDAQEEAADVGGVFRLMGHYRCTEMIGREQGEQIGEFYGKTD